MTSRAKRYLGFNDRWLMLIGIPIVSYVISALMFGHNFEEDIFFNISKCSLIGLVYVSVYWVVFRELFIYFRKKYPELKESVTRIVYQVITILVVYFLIKILLDIALHNFMHAFLNIEHPKGPATVIASLTVSFFVISIYETIFFYTQLQTSITEKEQLERENIKSQLEGLKNQVNPHFLFNSLNTLTYLIPEDPDRAVGFVQQLSKVYRYILEIKDEKLIPLSEELKFLDAYIFLLKERFGENFQTTVNIPDEFLTHKIAPLSLQLLLENAIKHNIISSLKPLRVEVFVEKGKLIVRNNLQKKNQVMNSTNAGLQNIKNRYSFFSNKKVEVLSTAEYFIVMLPLLKIAQKIKVS
jgi:two-component system, LytTR family, sensor kinase